MIPGAAPFAPAAPGKTVKRLMEVCRYKGGQAAHSDQEHCSTGPGGHVVEALPPSSSGTGQRPGKRQGTITDNEKGGRDPALIVVLPLTIGSTANLHCPYV